MFCFILPCFAKRFFAKGKDEKDEKKKSKRYKNVKTRASGVEGGLLLVLVGSWWIMESLDRQGQAECLFICSFLCNEKDRVVVRAEEFVWVCRVGKVSVYGETPNALFGYKCL